MKRVLHDYDAQLAAALKLVHEDEIHEDSRQAILRFLDHLQASGLTKARIARYTVVLRQAAKMLGKSFVSATRDDLVRVISGIERGGHAEATKANFRVIVKRFFKWLLGNDAEYPPQVAWIKGTLRRDRRALPQQGEFVTEEEVRRLLEHANHPRDRALIALLWDTGARIGEIGTLAIRDVAFDRFGGKVHLNGKTGPRQVRFILATPYVAHWLSAHLRRDDPAAPLWVSTSNLNRGSPVGWAGIRKMLRETFARAGISKKSNPHGFRHARATHLALHLTEFQMNSHFGWVQGSAMPATYVHLSGRDTDAALFRLNGIRVEDSQQTESPLKPRVCSRCETLNSPDSTFCRKCGGGLEIASTLRAEQERQEHEDLMALVLKDEEVQQVVQEALLKLKSRTNGNGGVPPSTPRSGTPP